MIGPAALAVAAANAPRLRRYPIGAGAMGFGLALAPFQALAASLMAFAVLRFRGAAMRRAALDQEAGDVLEAAELIALGLAGGLSVGAAHRLASTHAAPSIGPALEALVGSMERRGVAVALGADSSSLAEVSNVLLVATVSGAPALPALEAHSRQEHHRRHTAALERARRLPIRLLIPLTLLVLPGFVLITVGPTVADSLARLTI